MKLALITTTLCVITGCDVVTVRTNDTTTTASTAQEPRAHRVRHPVADAPSSTATQRPADTASPAPPPPPAPEFVTVMDRFPEITEADSLDLAKVKSVIDRATADMIYSPGTCKPTPIAYLPTAPTSPGNPDPDFIGVENEVGTPDHPYATLWTIQGEVRLGQRMPSALLPNTPLILWHAEKGKILAVTFDGGRYRIDGRPYDHNTYKFQCGPTPMLAHGVQGSVPPPVQHWAVTSRQIKALEDIGQMPSGTSQKIEEARSAASACTDKLWKDRFDARDKANTVANITEITRQNRRNQILSDYQAATPTACAAQKKRFDAAFEAAINANKQRRLALFQSVSTKLAALTTGNAAP